MCTDLDEEEEDTCCIRRDWDSWTILTRSITIMYTVICLAFTLVARLYIHAYYCSAFVAGWGVIVTGFVLWDNVCQIRNALGCNLRLFTTYEVILNTIYMTCNILMAVGYTLLTVISLHINYDYAYAAAFSCANALFLAYLLATSVMAYKSARSSNFRLRHNSLAWTTYPGYELEVFQNGDNMLYDNYLRSSEMSQGCCQLHHMEKCAKICRFIWRVFVAIIYYPTTFLFIVVLALSMCHPYFVLMGTLEYREADHMYEVELEGHRPLSLFMKCTGTGDTTLVYENGLGGMSYMQWDFLPQMLKDKYTVCVHDRRGYGWSEGASHDFLQLLWKEPQWSKINTEFFIKLVEKANISTPFYYMGHSYGGSHLVYTYTQRPDLIKGLIFLDSVDLEAAAFKLYLQLVVNFQPSGLFYILYNSGIFDATINSEFNEVSSDTLNQLNAAVTSSTYLETYLREWGPIDDKGSIYNTHPAVIYDTKPVTVPTLVIDKFNREYWFPDENFSQYNRSFYAQVTGTSHTSLVYSMNRTQITADLIGNFLDYTEGNINFNDYSVNKEHILADDSHFVN